MVKTTIKKKAVPKKEVKRAAKTVLKKASAKKNAVVKKSTVAAKTKTAPKRKTISRAQKLIKENTQDFINRVQLKAYALYEEGGYQDGADIDHWVRAEALIRKEG